MHRSGDGLRGVDEFDFENEITLVRWALRHNWTCGGSFASNASLASTAVLFSVDAHPDAQAVERHD